MRVGDESTQQWLYRFQTGTDLSASYDILPLSEQPGVDADHYYLTSTVLPQVKAEYEESHLIEEVTGQYDDTGKLGEVIFLLFELSVFRFFVFPFLHFLIVFPTILHSPLAPKPTLVLPNPIDANHEREQPICCHRRQNELARRNRENRNHCRQFISICFLKNRTQQHINVINKYFDKKQIIFTHIFFLVFFSPVPLFMMKKFLMI